MEELECLLKLRRRKQTWPWTDPGTDVLYAGKCHCDSIYPSKHGLHLLYVISRRPSSSQKSAIDPSNEYREGQTDGKSITCIFIREVPHIPVYSGEVVKFLWQRDGNVAATD